MNSHDKTLLGLSCHARSKCSECPYEDMPECSSKLAADAGKMLKAAVMDFTEAMRYSESCIFCKHLNVIDDEGGCDMPKLLPGETCWQWRGVEVE